MNGCFRSRNILIKSDATDSVIVSKLYEIMFTGPEGICSSRQIVVFVNRLDWRRVAAITRPSIFKKCIFRTAIAGLF